MPTVAESLGTVFGWKLTATSDFGVTVRLPDDVDIDFGDLPESTPPVVEDHWMTVVSEDEP